jgi:hypothetical protein
MTLQNWRAFKNELQKKIKKTGIVIAFLVRTSRTVNILISNDILRNSRITNEHFQNLHSVFLSTSCCLTATTMVTGDNQIRLLFYARSLANCKQGLVSLAPHIEILKLTSPCVVGNLPGILHNSFGFKDQMSVCCSVANLIDLRVFFC